MADSGIHELDSCVERLQRGEEAARKEILDRTFERLVKLARKMLKDYPTVKRWEETADVLQNASLRLWNSLEHVQIESTRHYFNLAALQLRRELIELARHYGGPLGIGANQDSVPETPADDSMGDDLKVGSDDTHEPTRIAAWSEFHEGVGALPEEEREVFELIWYHGMTQHDVAELLGVSARTVGRRWQKARRQIHELLGGGLPG